MGAILKKIVGIATMMLLLDGLWLGVIANKLYLNSLQHLVRGGSLGIDVEPVSAAVVYACMVTLFLVFLEPHLEGLSWGKAIGKSALLGLLVYGVYDFTNMATLKDWPLMITVVDTVWGSTLFMLTGVGYKFLISKNFFR